MDALAQDEVVANSEREAKDADVETLLDKLFTAQDEVIWYVEPVVNWLGDHDVLIDWLANDELSVQMDWDAQLADIAFGLSIKGAQDALIWTYCSIC